MTDPHHEYGDRLRRALNAEAESFQPSADGLERIRERIEAKRTRVQLPWWRPALAVGGALAVLGAVVVSTPDLRQRAMETLSIGTHRSTASETPAGQYPGGPPGMPSPSGAGTPTPSVSVSTTPTPSPDTGPDACPSTLPAPVVSGTPNPNETAQLLPSPTCPEPTPSSTPTPSPSDTTPSDPSPSPTSPDPAPSTSSPESGGDGTDPGTESGETVSGGAGTTSGTE